MAEMPNNKSQHQTSETGLGAAINIHNATSVVIGDDIKVSTSALSDNEYKDGFPENYANINTGLSRRSRSECTRPAERPSLTPRPHSTPITSFEADYMPNFRYRPRTNQLPSQSLPNKYVNGSRSKKNPIKTFRILNNPPEGMLQTREEFGNGTADEIIENIKNDLGRDPKKTEQFIVHELLPKLEKSCTDWSKIEEASVVITYLACASISDIITTHALELLLQLVSRNKLDGQTDKLRQIEEMFRNSITLDSFSKQKPELQEKAVDVFSKLMILLLKEIPKHNHAHFTSKSEEELKRVVAILEKRYKTLSDHKRSRNSRLKLALDVISEAVERIFGVSSRSEQHLGFLEEVNLALESINDPTKTKKLLKKYQKKHPNHSWFDVVYSINHICGQEDVPLLDKISLMQCLVKGYKKTSSIVKSDRTREFLAVISALFDIIIVHSNDKDALTKAMECLCEWHKNADSYCISPTIKAELKRYIVITVTLFGRSTDAIASRSLLDSQDHVELEYLKWFYRFYSFEIKQHTADDLANEIFFTRKVYFRGEPAVAKIMKAKRENVDQQRLPEQFISQVHYHYYLSLKQHPNIVQLLSFNTADPPYHTITKYVAGEVAQKYFENCSENNYHPPQTFLVYICLCVAKAAKFLSDQGFVHRALIMKNIFIGDDGNCKLSGMATVRPLSGTGTNAHVDGKGDKQEEKIPVYESQENDYPITHAAPESIRDGTFSTASDVWAFGVLLWETFTFGCPAHSTVDIDGNCLSRNPTLLRQYILQGNHLPKEDCIREEIYSLMVKCWTINPSQRPSFDRIIQDLEEFSESCKGNESAPATPPVIVKNASVAEYSLYNQEETSTCSSSIYSEPIGKPHISIKDAVRNSKEMKPSQRGYMPLTETRDNGYQFPNMEGNTPGCSSSGAPFLLGKPPAPQKHSASVKESAQEYANNSVIEKAKRETIRNRVQSVGAPVLPEALHQSLVEQICLRTTAIEKAEPELSGYHGLERVEEEVSGFETDSTSNVFSCKALQENTGEIDQGYYGECLGGKTDDIDNAEYDDVCSPPVYENLPCNDNDKRDSGFECQYKEDAYSFLDEHIYESIVPYQE